MMEHPDFSSVSAFGVEMQSSADRRGNARLQALEDVRGLLTEACARAGLDRSGWHCQATPHGELSLVPAAVPRSRLAVDLTRELVLALRDRNGDRAVPDRLRLRVAIHHGTPGTGNDTANDTPDEPHDRTHDGTHHGTRGALGSGSGAGDVDAGPPAAVVRRLLDAPQVSFSLDVRDADLALIVSDPLYQEIRDEVRALPAAGFQPESFRRVCVRDRGVDCVHLTGAAEPPAVGLLAWIQVPDLDSERIPPAGD